MESMSGARFVHDQLERAGWDVRIADARRVKGLAPLACKTDRIDAWVLAELARRDLLPEVWLPDPAVRAERERARFRLYLVQKRTSLKCRVHALLFQHGVQAPAGELFGAGGRRFLERLRLPEPWQSSLQTSCALIEVLDEQIAAQERALRRLGADHRYVRLLTTCPGIAWVWATRSPPSWARSAASQRPRSWSATPASARGCAGRARSTAAGASVSKARRTCAGR